MPIPDYQTAMLPLLKLASEGETTVPRSIQRLAPGFQLTETELEQKLPSGQQTVFANRLHWAKMYMVKAGLLKITRRGHFVVSDRGKAVLEQNPARIDVAFLTQYPEYVAWRQSSSGLAGAVGTNSEQPFPAAAPLSAASETATPEELIETAHATLLSALRADLLERIKTTTSGFFERLIIDLLVALGYGGGKEEMGKALGKSSDGGVDGIIKEDMLGLDVVYIQAKRYTSGSVGRPEVQAFAGSLAGFKANKGVFVTTSRFSPLCKEYVDRIQARIILIDGDELTRLMVKHNVGVRIKSSFEVKKVDEDYFETEI